MLQLQVAIFGNIAMLREVTAIRYDREAEVGRTLPLRVGVEDADGIEHDVILKLSHGPECGVDTLAKEMLGSLLAGDLGLPISEAFFVKIEQAFIDSLPNNSVRSRLQQSLGIGFGSKNAGRQWRKWEGLDKIPKTNIPLALSIIAFDAFCANFDRRPVNSNMLIKDTEWRLIDHEGAFGFRLLIPPHRPWVTGSLQNIVNFGQDGEHIFAQQLVRHDIADYDHVRDRWVGLSDQRFMQYEASLPIEWNSVKVEFSGFITHLKEIRDNIDGCIEELRRVLS